MVQNDGQVQQLKFKEMKTERNELRKKAADIEQN